MLLLPPVLLPPLVVGSGSPLLVLGSGSPLLLLLLLLGPTVASPEPESAVPLPVPLPVPVDVASGPCDTAPGEQSHSPNPAPCGSHVTSPSRPSSQGHGCVSPGTHDHGGTSGGSPLVLFMGSPGEPEQASPITEATRTPRVVASARVARRLVFARRA